LLNSANRDQTEAARLVHGQPDNLLEHGTITAAAHAGALTVATRNTRDFGCLGVLAADLFRRAKNHAKNRRLTPHFIRLNLSDLGNC
jgi:hypothetical protein